MHSNTVSDTKNGIAVVVEFFHPHIGGVEHVVAELGTRWAQKGAFVQIFTTDEPHQNDPYKKLLGGLVRVYKIKEMYVYRLALPEPGKRYIFSFLVLPMLFLYARNANVVYSANNYSIAFPVFLFSKLAHKPSVITFWEVWGTKWFSFTPPAVAFVFFLVEQIILLLPFENIIVASQFVRKLLLQAGKNSTVIPLAGKNLRFSNMDRTRLRKRYNLGTSFVFLYWGRLSPNKGVDILINAFADALKTMPTAKLLLFIPEFFTKEKQTMREQLALLHLEHHVQLSSSIPEQELAAHLSMADCVVFPDKTAAFGLSVAETSEMGRPIVVTDAGSFPEVAYGSVVVARANSTQSLSVALRTAYNGKFTKIPKRHFSWDTAATLYLEEFKKLLAKQE